MPIRLSDVMKESRKAEFEFSGETVTVEFRQNAVTPQFSEMILRFTELDALEDKQESFRAETALTTDLVEALVWLVLAWDVLGDNGKPIPITKANLRRLPNQFLYAVLSGILGINRPNEQSVES